VSLDWPQIQWMGRGRAALTPGRFHGEVMPARPRRKDEAERKKLQAIPTGLTIDPAAIARLVKSR